VGVGTGRKRDEPEWMRRGLTMETGERHLNVGLTRPRMGW